MVEIEAPHIITRYDKRQYRDVAKLFSEIRLMRVLALVLGDARCSELGYGNIIV